MAGIQSHSSVPVVGITGPPGAGKSTLISGLIDLLLPQHTKIGVLAVDPTSPFSRGSLLGDRIRMSRHFTNPAVFIRSMATRGSLGGLAAKSMEVIDLMKAAGCSYVLVETVGVGQSEVEIAATADTTLLVLVPEAGDEIQNIKSGVMEVADIVVINKADRPGADAFAANLNTVVRQTHDEPGHIRVLKTVAETGSGLPELMEQISRHRSSTWSAQKKLQLLTRKALELIRNRRTADINTDALTLAVKSSVVDGHQSLYQFVQSQF